MNRIVTASCRELRKIAGSTVKEKLLEAVLIALICQIIVQTPAIIYGFLPSKLQTSLVANMINAYTFIVNGPITLGLTHYFVQIFRGEADSGFSEIKYGFNNIYRALLLFLRIRIFTWFWSLFFVVPGIIASINYSQSFFILNENPNRSASECMYESKFVMRGNKMKYVCMMLGYLPIYIITSAPAGIAHIILDGESIAQIGTLLAQGNAQAAAIAATTVHPVVTLLMLISSVATAFTMPAQATFFDILAGKLVIQNYDDFDVNYQPEAKVVGKEDIEETVVDTEYKVVEEETKEESDEEIL